MSDKPHDNDRHSASSVRAKQNISDDVWNEAVNEWLGNNMRNSAMSGSAEAWNHLVNQLPELRKLLEGKL